MISNDPKFNLGQLNAYKLTFVIKLLIEKRIKNVWSAGFSDLPAINATVFSGCTSQKKKAVVFLIFGKSVT